MVARARRPVRNVAAPSAQLTGRGTAPASDAAARPTATYRLPVGDARERLNWLRRQPIPSAEEVQEALRIVACRDADSGARDAAVALLWAGLRKVVGAAIERASRVIPREATNDMLERCVDLVTEVIAHTTADTAWAFYKYAHSRIGPLGAHILETLRSPHRKTVPVFSLTETHGDADREEGIRSGTLSHAPPPRWRSAPSVLTTSLVPATDLLDDRQQLEAFLIECIDRRFADGRHRLILRHAQGLREFIGAPMEDAKELAKTYGLSPSRIRMLKADLYETVRDALGLD